MGDEQGLPTEAVRHYASGYEATRLFGSAPGELERIRTQEIIARFLPRPPARIVDVGGAAGVYSLWLLDQGYEVRLIDALPLHAELAAQAFHRHARREHASACVGDARQLDEADNSADVVLLMGPLYHLTERDDRLQALGEAQRVLRPGGTLFAGAISRFASLLDGLTRNFVDDPAFLPILTEDLETGQHRNPEHHPDYFTTTFFHHPDELAEEVAEAGFVLDSLLPVEGSAWLLPNLAERLRDSAKRMQLMDLLRAVEEEPSLIGVSAHFLAVARTV
ncbi:MAG TPA: class I SAM-dependent methyltransferase [Planctomycetaceae bacterium]|jgi:ubiquinone/menaquinone biosynthesis C-methylase UbiE|nr:class I SAM-dependent methyltransferase [Planctomycetaceae bacterium]